MIQPQNLTALETPSKGAIVKAILIALAVALVLLFAAVLPAEYGIDPLKTGQLLRLTGISQTDSNAGGRATPANIGIYTLQPATYKVDAEDIGLQPGDGFEIKYHMQKGATMVFAWKADGPVQFEFHGEPDRKPKPDYFESYLLDNKIGRESFYGSFTAPTTGVHGWFWQNKGKKEIRMHLSASGFFDSSKMYEAGAPPEDLTIEDPK
ncbi:MAG TPA: hypothetical protein VEV17_12945 [Bryobacteraceae bacterium]|nr:hypothetical protein [Bryobacteraceae bacterium]